MVDALREWIGLAPLYAAVDDRRRQDVIDAERFARRIWEWPEAKTRRTHA